MRLSYTTHLLLIIVLFATTQCKEKQQGHSDSSSQLLTELENAKPGDTIFIDDGQYFDQKLEISTIATKDEPVVLMSKNQGKVIFSGQSTLNISGEHIIVSGLIFNEGSSGKEPIINFRSSDGETVAKHCRVTECVITNYSNPDRMDGNHWIEIHGRENRFDHNYIGDKLNLGTTLIVDLKSEEAAQNNHSIDHNYFAKHSRFGSNGGETVRIGTSSTSLKESNTTLSQNFFNECNGEVEIISVKSGKNTLKDNVFYECQGVLTLRHGNGNLIEGNYFIGNGVPNTGGIRVINADHQIRNNVLVGLTGSRFYSAMAVLNGVPNSPINRYHQVNNVVIEENLFLNPVNIAFGVGSDNERTAVPTNTTFRNNSVFTEKEKFNIIELDDLSGIQFENNETNVSGYSKYGFQKVDWSPSEINAVAEKLPVTRDECGPSWYEKNSETPTSSTEPSTHHATSFKISELNKLLNTINEGDTIYLSEGQYVADESLVVSKDLVLVAESSADVSFIPGERKGKSSLVTITNGAFLYAEGIHFFGRDQYGDAKHAIATKAPMINHFKLKLKNCTFSDFHESSFSAVYAAKSTFADSVIIRGCRFSNSSGKGIDFASENDNRGRYNVEYMIIENCLFDDLMGTAIDIYRGGNDESTLGPFVFISECDFVNVNNKELGSAVRLLGVQYCEFHSSRFLDSGKSGRAVYFEDPFWANITVRDLTLHQSGIIQSFYDKSIKKSTIQYKTFSVNPEEVIIGAEAHRNTKNSAS